MRIGRKYIKRFNSYYPLILCKELLFIFTYCLLLFITGNLNFFLIIWQVS